MIELVRDPTSPDGFPCGAFFACAMAPLVSATRRSAFPEQSSRAAGAKPIVSSGSSVCLSNLHEGELIRILPPCEHRFHVACIDHWLATKTTCPVCRTDLQSSDPIVTAEDSEVTDKVEGGDNAV
ncbi:unnamed protein product [Closterium sp. Naga37s-1]|nr:unnamed protein product [Closterium sp. Naga37s-1]